MLGSNVTTGKASSQKMAAPSARKPQPRKRPPVSPSGQRSEDDKKALPSPPPPPRAKSATAKATTSASSHGGDSTATKNTAAADFEKLLRSLSGDTIQKRQSLSSSTETSSLEEGTTEEHSDRDELYRNVQDLLGEVLAGLDAESSSKKENQQGMVVLEDAVEAAMENMLTDLRPMVAPSAGRSGVGRASCDLTVRFADSDGPAKSRPDSSASTSRPQKNTKTAAAQAPIIKNKNKQPQPQQGTSLWPFRRNRVDTAGKPDRNAAAASAKVQSQSKQPPKRDSIGQSVDSELLAAMDRKISWGKAKTYPGSVTLSELNDDGTGTSKTRSLRKIKKRKPAEAQPQNKGGTSLLRSILGIVSSSQKTAPAPPRPQAKGAAKRPIKQHSNGSRQSSGKGSPSGSKASRKRQRRKEKKAMGAAVEPKENEPLPSVKEVPENAGAPENAVAPDNACTRADGPETPVAQVPGAKDHTATDAFAVDTGAIQEPVAEAAGAQCADSGPETCVVSASGD
ncbi:hypothetical protein HPB52_015898 [Rhipicephalus sanguineus]|uniref:Uncharacterized protein n=1 Tax=Rhipicephalus sanguineus TaxID=34632 RepID=A0A9D4PXW0_RHISA|nr:hypothetical protein HPB52_015898 [Rhipicephalus sanguineus]